MAPQVTLAQDARALLLMVTMAAADNGWEWATDKPRAAAALGYLLALVLCACLRVGAGRLLALVCTYGVASNAAGVCCVLWYPTLSAPDINVCDEGTGAPVGLALAVALLCVAAEFVRGRARND